MSNILQDATTKFIEASNGVRFAYRRLGKPAEVPLVMHIHFRANMDFWDPLFVNTLATTREVIIFDNAGIGRSSGEVKSSFQGWANDLLHFVKALELFKIDLLGFSLGGLAVQMAALQSPETVRNLIIAGSRAIAPVAHRMVKNGTTPRDPPFAEAIRKLRSSNSANDDKEALYMSFFPATALGRRHFENYWARICEQRAETVNLRLLALDKGADAQMQASIDDAKQANDPDFLKSYTGRTQLDMPVLIANGDDDLLIPTSRSWELLTKVDNAQLIIYPQAGHGFIWQYAERFAGDIVGFLDSEEGVRGKWSL